MRKTLTTAALLLALSCPALAGEMHTPVAAPTPPPPPSAAQGATAADDATEAEALTETVLNLLESVLALL